MDEVLISAILDYLKNGMRVALCEIVNKEGSAPRDVGAKMVVGEDGRRVGTVGGGLFEAELISDAVKAISEGRSKLVKYSFTDKPVEGARETGLICGGVLWVFIDVFTPTPRAIVIGLGNVGRPLLTILKLVGFELVVLDTNRDLEVASELGVSSVFVGVVDELVSKVRELVRKRDHVFVVYGDIDADYLFVRESLKTEAEAVWLLGSKRKVYEFVKKLALEGFNLDDVARRLRAPIGLDIGADTPEEIAVSVGAELVALKRGVKAESLNIVPKIVADLLRDDAGKSFTN
ncbi:MAG: XdhC family protein [Sulfolobales archaeon]|nr:XdhC family protein [Sulfolobales archaeon]MDW8082338.1 XdhC family protein [Sulfolobales archaeon]